MKFQNTKSIETESGLLKTDEDEGHRGKSQKLCVFLVIVVNILFILNSILN